MPMTIRGTGLLPVEAMEVVPVSATEGSTPAPPPPDPEPPLPVVAPAVLPVEPTVVALPAAVLPLTVATVAAPGGGGGAAPLVTPQVGVVCPACTSVGVRSPHE